MLYWCTFFNITKRLLLLLSRSVIDCCNILFLIFRFHWNCRVRLSDIWYSSSRTYIFSIHFNSIIQKHTRTRVYTYTRTHAHSQYAHKRFWLRCHFTFSVHIRFDENSKQLLIVYLYRPLQCSGLHFTLFFRRFLRDVFILNFFFFY